MSWRLRREVTGGGALFDLGAHILDLLYYVLGDFDGGQRHARHADKRASGGGWRG